MIRSLLSLRGLIVSTGLLLLWLLLGPVVNSTDRNPASKAEVRLAWRMGSRVGTDLRTTGPAVEETRQAEEPSRAEEVDGPAGVAKYQQEH